VNPRKWILLSLAVLTATSGVVYRLTVRTETREQCLTRVHEQTSEVLAQFRKMHEVANACFLNSKHAEICNQLDQESQKALTRLDRYFLPGSLGPRICQDLADYRMRVFQTLKEIRDLPDDELGSNRMLTLIDQFEDFLDDLDLTTLKDRCCKT